MCIEESWIFLPGLQMRHMAHKSSSHEDMIAALGLYDKQTGRNRTFLRGEAKDGLMEKYRIDENALDELPAWYTENENGYRELAARTLAQMRAWRAAYGQVMASAWDAYEQAEAPAWDAFEQAMASAWDARDQVMASAWAAREQAIASARAALDEQAAASARVAFEQVAAPAWAARNQVIASARAAYEQAVAPAWAAYEQIPGAIAEQGWVEA